MSSPGESGSDPSSEAEQHITLPLSVVRGLYEEVNNLGEQVTALQERLGALLSSQTVKSVQEEASGGTPPKAIELFSAAADAAAQPVEPLEVLTARAEKQNVFRENVQAQAAPYIHAITRAFQVRMADTEYDVKNLPPMPNYAEDPEAWQKYVKKYGQKLGWTESRGDQEHTYTCTYLPRQTPELVRFESASKTFGELESGAKISMEPELRLDIDQNNLMRIKYEDKHKDDYLFIKPWCSRYKIYLDLELGNTLKLKYGRTKESYTLVPSNYANGYVYNEEKGKFVIPYNHKYFVELDKCQEFVAEALAHVPVVAHPVPEFTTDSSVAR